jgi:toxin ParE1/3/4
MTYDFHPEALTEYLEAARWYESREPPVGLQFVAAIEQAIDRIVESPKRWRVIDEDIRRCLTRIFPYAILYTIEDEVILIVAVMHCSRKPGYWKSRIKA